MRLNPHKVMIYADHILAESGKKGDIPQLQAMSVAFCEAVNLAFAKPDPASHPNAYSIWRDRAEKLFDLG